MLDPFYKITPEQYALVKQWITALEGGDYKQGTKYLKQEAEGTLHHCCLGVLGEIAGLSNRTTAGHRYYYFGRPPYGGALLLPIGDFERLTGLPTDLQQTLSQLNDRGVTFAQIAVFLRGLLQLIRIKEVSSSPPVIPV